PDQRGPGPNDPAPADTTGLLITMHSYSELVLWPWGNKTTAAPNKVGLKAIGDKFATYNGYTSCQPSICLYITSGTTDDWGYGVLGIPSFTFEVGQQFMPSYSEIDSAQWPLNGPALQYAAKIVRTPYMLVNGPDALSVAVSDNGNDTYDLTATINDSSNGGQTVSQALYYVDTPPWDGGTGLPMAASDGSFNSAVENVDATINGSGLAAGRHTIFVQGTDSQGNAGPVGAAFLFVLEPGVSPTIRGYVREAGTNAPLSATVKAGSLFQTSTNPTTGYYEFQVVAGTYDLSAEADGHATVTLSGVTVNNYQTLDQDFSLSRVCDAFSEDVEAGQNGWLRQRPWAITTESSHSPTHSWTDSPGGNYRNNRNVGIGSPIINLTGYTDVTLNFWQICDTEAGYDYCRVEVSNNGGATWTEVATYDGPSSQWEEVSVDVSDLLDNQANVRLRFRLTTDVAIVDDGWHLDNIRLTGASDACY
ncbi:MAG: carboxypeptidase regulatory-like domain-containing protein, partial [Chloroflexota bacterium]